MTPAIVHRDRAARTCVANGRSFKCGLYGHKGACKRLLGKARRRAGRNSIDRAIRDCVG